MGQNWGLCPFWGREATYPSNTVSPGPRLTSVPSFILTRPTIWPQYTNVTDRTDIQTGQDMTTIRTHNPNGIMIGSAVFARMTTQCLYTLQWQAPFPLQNCPFPWGSGPPFNTHLIRRSLGPPDFSTQKASASVQPVSQGSLL